MNKKLFLIFVFINNLLCNNKIDKNIIICGVCKNIENQLPHSIKIIEKISNLFKNAKIIIYENNSNDNTKQLLTNWSKKNNTVKIISETLNKNFLEQIVINKYIEQHRGNLFKTELIARARNILLDEIFNQDYSKYSDIIMIDMDFMIEPRYEAFNEIFDSKIKWDAVFAYGMSNNEKKYWDWYAFRDYYEPLGSELLGNWWWYNPKNFNLKNYEPWYPVISAFGGCGIYKKDSIKGCRYSGIVNDELCINVKKIIENNESNFFVQRYFDEIKKIKNLRLINSYDKVFQNFTDPNDGIIINNFSHDIVWRMSSFVYSFPSVCEHVPFHAAMINRGKNKLFIVPNFIFYY